jgi:hypothetical protein
MLRHCSASTLSDGEGSTLLRAVSLSNGLPNGPSALLRAMGLSNGRWAFSDSFVSALDQAGNTDGGLRNGGPHHESLFPAGC